MAFSASYELLEFCINLCVASHTEDDLEPIRNLLTLMTSHGYILCTCYVLSRIYIQSLSQFPLLISCSGIYLQGVLHFSDCVTIFNINITSCVRYPILKTWWLHRYPKHLLDKGLVELEE